MPIRPVRAYIANKYKLLYIYYFLLRFRGILLKYPAQNIIINMTPPQAYDSFIKNKVAVTTIPMIDIQRTEFLFILYSPNNEAYSKVRKHPTPTN